MAATVHDCPHCGARNATFAALHIEQNRTVSGRWNVYGSCSVCGEGAVVVYEGGAHPSYSPAQAPAEIKGWQGFQIRTVHPKPRSVEAPDSVPPAASKAFVEGVQNLHDGRYTSAVVMFRRALEVALKEFAPEIEIWKLEKRIDKLASERLITQDLKAWAHKIRLEANGAVHELDDPSRDDAEEMKLFTELLLMYLFSLPARIRSSMEPGSSS